MNSETREKRLSELRTELRRLISTLRAGGSIDNSARVKQIRRTVAQILTIQRQDEQQRKDKA